MRPYSLRYDSLDLWRGVAVLWVCLHHAFMPLGDTDAPFAAHGVLELASLGNFGVQFFFVISGFCIGVRTDAEWQRRAPGGGIPR